MLLGRSNNRQLKQIDARLTKTERGERSRDVVVNTDNTRAVNPIYAVVTAYEVFTNNENRWLYTLRVAQRRVGALSITADIPSFNQSPADDVRWWTSDTDEDTIMYGYNFIEAINTPTVAGSDVQQGNGVAMGRELLYGATNDAFHIQPVPIGTVVILYPTTDPGGETEYWFSYENGIDGECSTTVTAETSTPISVTALPGGAVQVGWNGSSVSGVGSNTQIIYNSGGVLTGDNNFVINSSQIVSVGRGYFIYREGNTANTNVLSYAASSGSPAALGGVVNMQYFRGTVASPAAVTQNDLCGTIGFYGADAATAAARVHGTIRGYVDGTVSGTTVPGRLMFATRNLTGTFADRMGLYANGNLQIGTPAGANYSEFESGTGFLKHAGTAIPWEDLTGIPISTSLGSGTKAPGTTTFVNNTRVLVFDDAVAANEKEIYTDFQFSHAYQENSNIYLHFHYSISATVSATVAVRCAADWTWASPLASFNLSTGTVVWTENITPFMATGIHYMSSDVLVTAGTKGISSIFKTHFYRNSSNASDTYTGDMLLHAIDPHYTKDTGGSRARTAK